MKLRKCGKFAQNAGEQRGIMLWIEYPDFEVRDHQLQNRPKS